MTTPRNDADDIAEVTQPVDPIRAAFGDAIAALMEALPPSWMRDTAVKEMMSAYDRTRAEITRRIVN